MNHIPAFALLFSLLCATTSPSFASNTQEQGQGKPRLVRFSVINMSGKSREARIHRAFVTLPVAEAVTLQAFPGEAVTITSDTNQKISRTIVISSSDEGHLYPID
jgi:hypothetical protein